MYQIAESLRELAAEVIENHNDVAMLKLKLPRIAFLYCDTPKRHNRKLVFADTQKVEDKIKVITKLDFIIRI